MGEIKQANFRINQDAADAFRRFCESQGMNQAQGFDHIMEVFEMDKAKSTIPERRTEIEDFERLTKGLISAYLRSIELNASAEERVREQFASDLNRKNKTIDELRQKVEQLQTEKDATEAMAAEAVKAKDQAEKDAAAAEKVRVAAEKTAVDKQTIADTLAAKLAEAEKKAEGYDDLKAALSSSEDTRKALEQQIKDVQRDALEEAKEAAREAEKATEKAVREASDILQAKISSLQDELRASRSETDAARRDAETAKTAAIAELSESHRAEVAEIRAKLDDRTDDLMQTRQEISELKLQLQVTHAEIERLKTQQ